MTPFSPMFKGVITWHAGCYMVRRSLQCEVTWRICRRSLGLGIALTPPIATRIKPQQAMRPESIKAFFLRWLCLGRQSIWFKQNRTKFQMITNSKPSTLALCSGRPVRPTPRTQASARPNFLISITLPIGALFRRGSKRPRISELKGRQGFGAQTLLRMLRAIRFYSRFYFGALLKMSTTASMILSFGAKPWSEVTADSNSLLKRSASDRTFGARVTDYGALQIIWN
jgi:hypothetical protein